MATLRLQNRRVDALKPRKSTFDVRDRDFKSFGVRVPQRGHVVLALPDGRERRFDPSGHIRYWLDLFESQPAGAESRRPDALDRSAANTPHAISRALCRACSQADASKRARAHQWRHVVRAFPDSFCRLNPFSTAAACAEAA